MNDVMIAQLAISKLRMEALLHTSPSDPAAVEALAELNTALSELEAINEELTHSNTALAEITVQRDLEARHYRELFEHTPVACVVTDEWGVIEVANSAAEKMLNVERARLQGKPISVFVPLDNRREFRDRMARIPESGEWQIPFQPRERDRLMVGVQVVVMPGAPGLHQRLCWVMQNVTPQQTAAQTEKLLARQVTLRIQAETTVTRLRALHGGLEQMQDDKLAIPARVTLLLETLVPRYARSMTCKLPGTAHVPIVLGDVTFSDHMLDAPIHAPLYSAGRLVARRPTRFSAEDSVILSSAANAITAMLCSIYNACLSDKTN